MRIIFVRHGEPDYERDCLTAEGRRQASAVSRRLKEEGIEEIWSSPMGRALETARTVSADLNLRPVRTLTYMRELDWGSLDDTPIFAGGHPWDIADELVRQGWDLTDPAWPEHPMFSGNTVTACVHAVAEGTDRWLASLGYTREGAYYRCRRPDDRQTTVALFCHGGSSSAALARILDLPFPYVCATLHMPFTALTIVRFDRQPGRICMPVLELASDGRHLLTVPEI